MENFPTSDTIYFYLLFSFDDIGCWPTFLYKYVIILVIMHYSLCISHYAGCGTQSKVSNTWVASDSLWLEPLLLTMYYY